MKAYLCGLLSLTILSPYLTIKYKNKSFFNMSKMNDDERSS